MGIPYAEVIGDPIEHSKSPLIHNFWLQKLGLEGEYRRMRVKSGEVAAYLEYRRADVDWRGCNVTMPLKVEALSLADGALPTAKAAGAANLIFPVEGKLAANNSDMRGFAEPFRSTYPDRGKALLIGTGAAARTCFVALAALNFDVFVTGRNRDRAKAMLNALGQPNEPVPLERTVPPVDLLVNASAMGMAGKDTLDLDLSALPPTAIVYDIVYHPLETGLLANARRRGLRTIDGITMLIGQAEASFCHFFGGRPPREHDAELRGLLLS